ncbi:MAG TPA: MEDS domain-containing protein [Candidatus Acidoferrum sp.]|nr:MEDS domain-containing protein [Candidatus Acidoferrum sp.]
MQGIVRSADDSHVSATQGSWSKHGDHQHGVQFYSQDKFLLEELSGYIGGALRAGDAAVVVATEAHRNGLLQWVTAQGLDVTDLLVQGRFVALDARQTLAAFMVEGWPNEELFNKVIGAVVTKASAAARRECPRVAIFGEMVALLWADGKSQAAIRLEQLWNDLARKHSFSLFCAYPMSAFQKEEDAELLLKVCNEHSAVIPTETYMGLDSEGERLRNIAQLQQKARALETEVAEHKRLRQELELHVRARTAELQGKNAQLVEEIKRREDAETSLRTLTSQLMLIRDEERRRVAHELHESTAQVLATLSMNLCVLGDIDRPANASESKLITESASLVDGLLGEVRQLSHLLHPPTLDEMGLPSAIQWYSEQFAKRTNIHVTLQIPTDFGRLSREREIAMFRVVQEALANVHEHSGSPSASIRLSKSGGHACLQVSDLGKGMSGKSAPDSTGVGINGMRERLRQRGGVLTIHSSGRGTLITADLPL